MRIALVTPEYPGCGPSFGVGSYVETLARGLAAHREDVVVLAVTATGLFRVEPARGAVSRVGDAVTPAVARPWRAARWLEQELAAFEPQVVEFSNWQGLGAAVRGPWLAAVRLSSPISVARAPDPLRRLAARVHHWNELRTVRGAALVISDSHAMARLGREAYGRDAHVVIPHAFAGGLDEPAPGAQDVLCVGRLQERKGTDVLIEAWSSVRRKHPVSRLHLVGSDEHGFGERSLRLHGRAGIEVHGFVDDAGLRQLRRGCRVQAIPSRFESFGLVVLEAWAAGLAPVVSSGGALPEVAGDGAEVVPAGDAGALASAITDVLADAERAARLVEAGRERLRTLYSVEAVVRATLAAYAAALRR